jgi:hypothetical protein
MRRHIYNVTYRDGRYIIQILGEKPEKPIGFYKDKEKRTRPITKRKKKHIRVKQKIVNPLPERKAREIIKSASISSMPSRRIIKDWWIPEAQQLYNYLRKYNDNINPIEIQNLFRVVKKYRPEWDWDIIYEYIDKHIDPALTYGENKRKLIEFLGPSEEDLKYQYRGMSEDLMDEWEREEEYLDQLYKEYLMDVEGISSVG